MLHLFSWQVIEKQHRMMEQLGSQIKVFTSSHLRVLHIRKKAIHWSENWSKANAPSYLRPKLFWCVMDRSLPSSSK